MRKPITIGSVRYVLRYQKPAKNSSGKSDRVCGSAVSLERGSIEKRYHYTNARCRDRYSQWRGSPDGGDNIAAPGVLMLNDFTQAEHIYVACGYTDLRKGIDGFALLVKEEFSLDPFSRKRLFL